MNLSKVLVFVFIVLVVAFFLSKIGLNYWLKQQDNIQVINGKEVIIVKQERLDDKGHIIKSWSQEEMNDLKIRAEKNDVEAQAQLGYLYLTGDLVNKNLEKSEYWLKKAVDNDHYLACFDLGYLYDFLGEKDKAIYFYKKSESKGNPYAKFNLAVLLESDSVPDVKEIIHLYEEALLGIDNPEIVYFPLAWWYLNDNQFKNEQRGLKLLMLAAQHGDHEGEAMLGEMYELGDLVPKDLKKSRELYERAAKKGNEFAMKKLSELENN